MDNELIKELIKTIDGVFYRLERTQKNNEALPEIVISAIQYLISFDESAKEAGMKEDKMKSFLALQKIGAGDTSSELIDIVLSCKLFLLEHFILDGFYLQNKADQENLVSLTYGGDDRFSSLEIDEREE